MNHSAVTPTRFLVLLSAVLLTSPTVAAPAKNDADDGGWQASPLRLPVEGRARQRIPFELEVTCEGKQARLLQVRLVPVAQTERGNVDLGDGELLNLDARLETPARFRVQPDSKTRVRGWVRPTARGPRHRAFGVLVEEVRLPDTAAEAESSKSELQVEFAVRYLTRVEVEVHGARVGRSEDLQIVAGGLIPNAGRAVARVVLDNSGEAIFPVAAEAQLLRADDRVRVGPSFPLILPIKQRRQGELRTGGRIYPGARLRMESLVPDPISPGSYLLVVRLRLGDDRRVVELPVEVAEDAFPAQSALLPRVVASVGVEPARLELGSGRGFNRMVPLKLHNQGDVAVRVAIASRPRSAAGESQVFIRPADLTLRPGATRRVAVIYAPSGDTSRHHYETLQVDVRPVDGSQGGSHSLPVALAGSGVDQPRPEVGSLTARPRGDGLELVLPVHNAGQAHLPLHGQLRVEDPYGRVLEQATAGFGAWLLPGERGELAFVLPRPLPPGDYRLVGTLEAGPVAPPMQFDQPWSPIGAEEPPPAAQPPN